MARWCECCEPGCVPVAAPRRPRLDVVAQVLPDRPAPAASAPRSGTSLHLAKLIVLRKLAE